MASNKSNVTIIAIFIVIALLPFVYVIYLVSGTGRKPVVAEQPTPIDTNTVETNIAYEPMEIGFPKEGRPWIPDLKIHDLDKDGDIDLVVGQFGYAQGEIRWMENHGDWNFESHILLVVLQKSIFTFVGAPL